MSDETGPDIHARQQMLMARPWHVADGHSIWEISGRYPGKRGSFICCLAQVLPGSASGTGEPLFRFLGAMGTGDGYDVVGPAQITSAVPLLLVHRSEPGTPYWPDDAQWMPAPDMAGGAS